MSKPILVIDDDPWQLQQYARVLTREGYDPSVATHPRAAMEAIEKRRPLAIILDVLLEYNTAFLLLHELQSDIELSTLPVIVCTGQDQLQLTALKPYGVVALLHKTTMHPDDIVKTLAKLSI